MSHHHQEQNATAEAHVAGMISALSALRELIAWPLLYWEEGLSLGVQWPRGVLLHGPPGVGKTLLVNAVARECGASVHPLSAASVFGSFAGESEERMRKTFADAEREARAGRPAIVFIDEIDALCPRRDARRQQEARVVAQLLTLMDGIAGKASKNGKARVLVVAATNRPNALDQALRRPGRFDREVAVTVPNASERLAILELHSRSLPLADDVSLAEVAAECNGYTGADLAALSREAAMLAMAQESREEGAGVGRVEGTRSGTDDVLSESRECTNTAMRSSWDGLGNGHEMEGNENETSRLDLSTDAREASEDRRSSGSRCKTSGESRTSAGNGGGLVERTVGQSRGVCMADWRAAMLRVGPSVVRGSAAEVPAVSWDDIGGLHDVKRRLQQAVEWPIQHADSFRRLGLSPPRGVLLHGPPGCCKTTLARAAAHAAKCTLFSLSGAELFSMYVGEGEALLRETFRCARLAAPAIVFFDEADAVATRRAAGGGGGVSVQERLLSSLLTEMDGLELAQGILVMAATNRPHALDAALVRPGRFDLVLYVPPPDEEGRLEALRVHTRKMALAADVDLPALARDTELFTGAELAGLCREAALTALREDLSATAVAHKHFLSSRQNMRPALTPLSLASYASFDAKLNSRSRT